MPPTYQVPWDRLERACAAFRDEILGKDDCFDRLFPLFFLCGLHFQVSYFSANHAGKPKAKQSAATHLIDDGLAEACARGLVVLFRIATSRVPRHIFGNLLEADPNSEWSRLQFAFLDLTRQLPVTVQRWIDHGNRDTNLIRFGFGMGVQSPFADSSSRFVHSMLKKPFGWTNAKGDSCTACVREIMRTFTWNPEWVLPEL